MADVTHKVVVDLDINTEPAKAKVAELEKMIQALTRGVSIGGGASGPGGAAPSPAPGESATGQMPAGTGGPMTIPTNPGGRGGGAPAPTATPGGTVPTPSSPGGAPPSPSLPPAPGGRSSPGVPGPSPNAVPGDEAEPVPTPNPGSGGGDAVPGGRSGRTVRRLLYGHAALSGIRALGDYYTRGQTDAISAQSNTSATAAYGFAAAGAERNAGLINGVADAASTGAMAFGGPAGFALSGALQLGKWAFGTDESAEAAKLRMYGQAVDFYGQQSARKGRIDEQQAMLGLSGSRVSARGAIGYAYTPEEAIGIAGAFAGGAGMTGVGGDRALAIARSGVSPGAAGAYLGTTAAGAGGLGRATPEAMIGLAQAQGLRGSKVDEFLGIIASATSSMATQGMKLDMAATEQFTRRLQGTGSFAGQGLAQARAAATLAGTVGGARQKLLSPFSGMAETAIMADAMSRSSSVQGAARLLEQVDPSAVSGMFGRSGFGDMIGLDLARSMTVDQGADIAGGRLGSGDAKYGMISAGGKGMAIKQQEARGDWALMNRIDEKKAIQIFEAQLEHQKYVLDMGKFATGILEELKAQMQKAFGN